MTTMLDDDDPDASLLVRTDFADQEAWDGLVAAAGAAYGPDRFVASFVAVADASFDGMAPEDLAAVGGSARIVFAADATSMLAPEQTLVVVDRVDEPGRWFRVALPAAWAVENNLRLANMEFSEFSVATDPDGVFRGFAT